MSSFTVRGRAMAMTPTVTVNDNELIVRGKSYPLSKLTSAVICATPTMLTNGLIIATVDGKQVTIGFANKDSEGMYRVHELLSAAAAANAPKDIADPSDCGTSAEALYDFCAKHGCGQGFSREWGIRHFRLISNTLQSDERLILPFIGLNGYKSMTKHDGNYAYAITDKRIIMSQQKAIGQHSKIVSLQNINDVSIEKNALMGVIVIDARGETLRIGLNSAIVQNVYEKLLEGLKSARASVMTQAQPVIVQQTAEKSPVEQVKELKELLDMGIITQDEFDRKKNELLGL